MKHESEGKTRRHLKMGGQAKKPLPYNAQGSEVEKEAEEKKRGGKVGAHVEGHMKKHRLDRPGRKRGGSVGADMHPLTNAAKVKNAEGHDANTGNSADYTEPSEDD